MRYGILLLTLFILSDSFSLVFAQSMYKFKGKSTNISPGRIDTDSKKSMDTYSGKSMDTYPGKSSVISPYASLIGKAHCGKIAFLGTNSSIMGPRAKLGNYSKLSAGSILYKKTVNKCLVVGNPAKVFKQWTE